MNHEATKHFKSNAWEIISISLSFSRAFHSPQPLERPCLQRCGHLSGDKSGRRQLPTKKPTALVVVFRVASKILKSENQDHHRMNTQKKGFRTLGIWMQHYSQTHRNDSILSSQVREIIQLLNVTSFLASSMKLNSFLLEDIRR